MTKLFLCYRRNDNRALAGRVYEKLKDHFGANNVFMDVQTSLLGFDFRKIIADAIGHCDALVVLVGPHWDKERLRDADDYVRIEIEASLRRGIPVIPVLYDGATMPDKDDLPDALKDFAFRNALNLDTGPDFDVHTARLIRGIEVLGRDGSGIAALGRHGSGIRAVRHDGGGVEVAGRHDDGEGVGPPATAPHGTIDETVPQSRTRIHCAGTLAHVPAGLRGWLVVEVNGLLWPKEPALAPDPNGQWSCAVHDGGTSTHVAVRLYLVTEARDAIFREWLADGHATGDYPGMPPTPDMLLLATRERVPIRA